MKLTKDTYPYTIETIEKWFGEEAPRLIAEARWSGLWEAWFFDYKKAFSENEIVSYYVNRDGDIGFLP